jgi:hydrogenase expression/formation protein HypC
MPGKVLAVKENIATVDFSGNIVEAQADLVSVKPGDYVLVHAGFILQKLSQEEGSSLAQLFREIESYE